MSSKSAKKVKEYMCVMYPGKVVNVDNMIKSLGGIEKLAEVKANEDKCLQLRTSDHIGIHPLISESKTSNSILIKVKRKRKKKVDGTIDESVRPILSAEVVASVRHTHTFEGMSDFQVLTSEGDSLDLLNTDGSTFIAPDFSFSDWVKEPAPMSLNPSSFSRMDMPQDYHFKITKNEPKFADGTGLCRTRQKRSHYAIFLGIDDRNIPQEPLEEAVTQLKSKFIPSEKYEKVVSVFQERPAWSKNALEIVCGIDKDRLKYILPCVSYYFSNGPWRNLWVRLKYDPRKDPEAWKYQTFDFRFRRGLGRKHNMDKVRNLSSSKAGSFTVLPTRSKMFNTKSGSKRQERKKDCTPRTERFYIYRSGILPPYRQMFYQICDIEFEPFQELIKEALGNKLPASYNSKSGWLPPLLEKKGRDLLDKDIENTMDKLSAPDEVLAEYSDSEFENENESHSDETEDSFMEEDQN